MNNLPLTLNQRKNRESNLAWIACGWDPQECATYDIPLFPKFNEAARNQSVILFNATFGDSDAVHAFSFCFWITMAQFLPYVFLFLLLGLLLLAGIKVYFQTISITVTFAAQAVAYTHMHGEEVEDDAEK